MVCGTESRSDGIILWISSTSAWLTEKYWIVESFCRNAVFIDFALFLLPPLETKASAARSASPIHQYHLQGLFRGQLLRKTSYLLWNPSQRAMLKANKNLPYIYIGLWVHRLQNTQCLSGYVLRSKDRMGVNWAQIAGGPCLLKPEMVQNPAHVSL